MILKAVGKAERENGIIAGVHEIEGAREVVVILLKDVWHSAVILTMDMLALESYRLSMGGGEVW